MSRKCCCCCCCCCCCRCLECEEERNVFESIDVNVKGKVKKLTQKTFQIKKKCNLVHFLDVIIVVVVSVAETKFSLKRLDVYFWFIIFNLVSLFSPFYCYKLKPGLRWFFDPQRGNHSKIFYSAFLKGQQFQLFLSLLKIWKT